TYEMGVKLPVLVRDGPAAPDDRSRSGKARGGEVPRGEPAERGGAAQKLRREWEAKVAKWETDGKVVEKVARGYEARVAEAHHRGDRFDLGELAVELALVLCSVAILTKRPGFWYSGITLCALGLAVALSAYLPHEHEKHGEHGEATAAAV